ncbi:MAG: aromatic-ring-hydroxylating dioxygenase subunit beta [Aromatoleum sp.]|jgi:p-cumate 2,3-dioxygenase beta subunit|uniref:aromatic-ring-hydroxylating dioxygenase subunit beta n=1 Tax=Aromatoleum sp. TaxID=2307007 RepID=UPI0028946A3D|nr:aromatic-ring-hydroxylating dioxygenase subunit beta [Aromatoleum sp.]MDT3670217.1 aromatic-ring-hydroxylating dioxygenase subunit beta [Aromatoleum sp.]
MNSSTISQQDAERFLVQEAEILDDWRLHDWPKLYTKDAVYEVTGPGAIDPVNARPEDGLNFLIADRFDRIEARANRLMKEKTHCEYPHSKTRHLVTNFRVQPTEDGGTNVRANFTVWRTKENKTTAYMGEYRYSLVRQEGEIKVRAKRCILDLNTLFDQGRLTIIL